MGKIVIATATVNQTPLDWENNLSNIKNAIQKGASLNADVLLFPELCITGYGCEDLFLSDWLYEKSWLLLLELSETAPEIGISVGLPIKWGGVRYNCSAFLYGGGVQALVAKQYLANDGVHYEPRWFSPWPGGKQVAFLLPNGEAIPFGDVTIDFKGIKIGYEICEDAWRKEKRPLHGLASKGVSLILNPSASHFAFGKTKRRENEVIGDAVKEYEVVYAYANLLGNEAGRIIYDGEMMVATPSQGIIAKNKRFSFLPYQVMATSVDMDTLIGVKLKNEDKDTKEEELPAALSIALFDYLRKSHSKGFVLSLSGGADSSITAVMVSEMAKRAIEDLGLEGFIAKLSIEDLSQCTSVAEIMSKLLVCVYQWSKNSSWETFDSAQALAKEIGATFYSWRIDKEVSTYTDTIEVTLQRKLKWETDDIALQNIQARARSPIIWMLANLKKALLLTTSNRSEGDVGYATMDGDTSGSIAPIAGLDKDYIRKWLLWAEKHLGYSSLRHVNHLAPSAELRPQEMTQTDEKDLMPYHVLAEIEKLAIYQWKSPIEVFEDLKIKSLDSEENLKKHISKFYRLWSINQWKRERIAPSFLLDDFNVDPRTWCRFPILSGGFHHELQELEQA